MNDSPFRVLITGASGLVGSALSTFLKSKGCTVVSYARGNSESLEGFDVVIHLAGESISSGLWTKRKKQRIWESRIDGTRDLVTSLNALTYPPKVFISASAIGYYSSSYSCQNENSPPGKSFLSSLCVEWERASSCFKGRSAQLRFGFILSKKGGFLKAILPIFLMGLGGRLGDGKQYISWIALEDVLSGIYHVITKEDIQGPINFVTPNPIPQGVFTNILAKSLKRPSFFFIPKWILLGEKNRELILSSLRISPVKLLKSGFSFLYEDLSLFFKEKL